MITDFILSAVFGGINALLSLAPSYTLPTSSAGTAFQLMQSVNHIMPIADIGICIAAFITLRTALQGWDFVAFVYHQFWGSD